MDELPGRLHRVTGFIAGPPAAAAAAAAAARAAAVGLGSLAIAGTLLSLRRSPHWFFRVWDFPRLQIAGSAITAATVLAATGGAHTSRDRAFLGAVGVALAVQARKIGPYTPLARVQVQRSAALSGEADRCRLMVANVLRENTRHELFLERVREHRPDVIVAVEVDRQWEAALAPLAAAYPHVLRRAQENHYGMMLYSRLPLEDTRIEYLVHSDVPSMHVTLVLRSGRPVRLHALHPRPPEPLRDQSSTARDAELVILARRIEAGNGERPTIVAGDLNDVAWSHTSRLFLRLSGLLDPRVGRGFYNSYNAGLPLLRWPLDHVFHSKHFRLVALRRLESIGSDHFPMLVELSYEPDAGDEQQEPHEHRGDRRQAEERVAQLHRERENGEDRPVG